MNKGLEEFRPLVRQIDLNRLPPGVTVEETNGQRGFTRDRFSYRDAQGQMVTLPGHDYYVLNAINSSEIASGKYLYSPKSGQIEVQWIQGIGSERAPAPQAQLMSTVINGILTRKLPWGLVMLGVFLVIVVELLGIRSLAFAVGAYISIGTTLAIFAGGVVRWLVESAAKRAGETPAETDVSPGSLYASGLIAAGGIMGLAGIGVKLIFGADKPNPLDISSRLPAMGFGALGLNVVAVIAFLVLAWSLYHFARKPLGSGGSTAAKN